MFYVLEKIKKKKFLSEKEQLILQLISEGKSNIEIAERMFLSEHTIKMYVRSILDKMNVDSRVQAAVQGVKSNII